MPRFGLAASALSASARDNWNKLGAEERGPRNISGRMRKARHKPVSNRIAHGANNDGGRIGGMLRGARGGRCDRDDDIHLETDEFGSQSREALGRDVTSSLLEVDVPPLDIAEFDQLFANGIEDFARHRRVGCRRGQEADSRDFRDLLRESRAARK